MNYMIISLIAIAAMLMILKLFSKVDTFTVATRADVDRTVEDDPETLDESAEIGIKYALVEWSDGERIGLHCPDALMRKTMTIEVSSHKNDGHLSYAHIPDQGKRFRCRRGKHAIYGVYPASAMLASGDDVKVAGNILESQILVKDPENPRLYKSEGSYMYSVSSLETGSGMRLAFRPLMTTLSFQIHSPSANHVNRKLLGLALSSCQEDSYLAGSFTATLNAAKGVHEPLNRYDVLNGTNTIHLSLDEGIILGDSSEEGVTIEIQAIPMDHSKLRLTLLFEGNVTRSLNLKKNEEWIRIPACTRANFKNLGIPGVILTKDNDPHGQALCIQGLA